MVVSSSSSFSEYGGFFSRSSKKKENNFLVTLSSLVALVAKKTRKLTWKKTFTKGKTTTESHKSPLDKPKQILNSISNKAITLVHRRKKKNASYPADQEWGHGGVWQKTIIMGDKCQPLDFSGVIYYDGLGNQLDELPIKSPRASPMPAYLTRH